MMMVNIKFMLGKDNNLRHTVSETMLTWKLVILRKLALNATMKLDLIFSAIRVMSLPLPSLYIVAWLTLLTNGVEEGRLAMPAGQTRPFFPSASEVICLYITFNTTTPVISSPDTC
jgi:hypothetical protein